MAEQDLKNENVVENEELPVNPLREVNVIQAGEVRDENGVCYDLQRGIDVSEHQGEIDWTLMAENKPDFVLIRCGFRGYGEAGRLCADAYYEENLRGALALGVPVGLYFFSQAVNEAEAVEEAEFLLELLSGYSPADFSLPVFFDWEEISVEAARTDGVPGSAMTECALAFCRRMEEAGFAPGIYAYRSLAYYRYDLPAISAYPLWIGAQGYCPDFYYGFQLWQYSTAGECPGISGSVDLDMIFVPKASVTEPTEVPDTQVKVG